MWANFSIRVRSCHYGEPDARPQYFTSNTEGQFHQAETHFLAAGNRDGARSFAEMMATWLPANGDPGAFAARGVIP